MKGGVYRMLTLHSPPSGKEGWLKAGVVGGYTMLIITDLRIHLPPPPTGTPPSRRRRMENTIDYQIIIFLINFATKSEKEPLLHESDEKPKNYSFC